MRTSVYLDPAVPLEDRMQDCFKELGVEQEIQKTALSLVTPLKDKSPVTRFHYEHSIRVMCLGVQVARFIGFDKRAILYPGLLHDIGKLDSDPSTLGKEATWSEDDACKMENHPIDGWRQLCGVFDFTAEVVLRHHRFQKRSYPKSLPERPTRFSRSVWADIYMSTRILALVDAFDAMHRINARTGGVALTGEEIMSRMLNLNADQRSLVGRLYDAGILTLQIYEGPTVDPVVKPSLILTDQ